MKKTYLNILLITILTSLLFNNGYSQTLSPIREKTYSNYHSHSQIKATIVVALTADHEIPLYFGDFLPEDSKSSIIISPEGDRMVSGNIGLKEDSYSAAKYSVSGENAVSCKIILPDSPTILTNSDNSKTLEVSDWHANVVYNSNVNIDEGNLQEISLGATLYVGSKDDNPAGCYDGTYAITFMYN